MEIGIYLILAALALVVLWVFFYLVPLGLWFQCILTGVRMSLIQLILMRWRKVPPSIIVNALINSKKAGLDLSADQLEALIWPVGMYKRWLMRLSRPIRQIFRSILRQQQQ